MTWRDGTVDHWPERTVPSGGRSLLGRVHEILIRDFYARLDEPAPFWISPAEARKSMEILKEIYRQKQHRRGCSSPLTQQPRKRNTLNQRRGHKGAMTDKKIVSASSVWAPSGMYAQFIDQGMVPNMQIGAICDCPAREEGPR